MRLRRSHTRPLSMILVGWVLIHAMGTLSTSRAQEPPAKQRRVEFLEDFDVRVEGGLRRFWTAAGSIQLALEPVEVESLEQVAPETRDQARTAVAGRALRIVARPGTVAARRLVEADQVKERPALADCGLLRFWVRPRSADQEPVVLEVRFYEGGRRAWWWRKLTLDRPGWQQVELKLNDFRDGGGLAPEWEQVELLGFWFRTPGEIELDHIELIRGDRPGAAYLDLEELAGWAFGPENLNRIHRHQRAGSPFVVLTDVAAVDGPKVLDALEAMRRAVKRDFPGLPDPSRPVPLLIFRSPEEYRAFWPRFAGKYLGIIDPPQAQGFSALGVATASVDTPPDRVRATYVHETNHALLHQCLGIANQGEWLMEGLAVRYQLEFTREDIRRRVDQMLNDRNRRVPLATLLNGKPIGIPNYPQAKLVVDWLLDDPAMKPGFAKALAHFRNTGSTDMTDPERCREWFGKEIDQLERDWLTWLQTKRVELEREQRGR
ncbi:hypothetical protein Isop_3254 [Isosphaera pallida ATCC 43644]|uniref:DUF1570 domain-containing protein n=2 Tax=Isosphaera pallida TaxID=128 RepID=E8R563_ISOPI|nr:hypothetical protein Isop_3254 [Isosphaera pallida ATCC 43644]